MDLRNFSALMQAQTIGPAAYDHFTEEPATRPYLVYGEDPRSIFWADNQPIHMPSAYAVLLYTDKKNPATERLTYDLLAESGAIVIQQPDEWENERGVFVTEFSIRY